MDGLIKQTILFKFFKGCLPQILLGPFLNTLSHIKYVIQRSEGTNICLTHFRPMFHFTPPENTFGSQWAFNGNIGQLWVKVDCLFK